MEKSLTIPILLIALCFIHCNKDLYSKDPSTLGDPELVKVLETTKDRNLTEHWLEAEKREIIFIKFIAQDKSGTILKLTVKEIVSDTIITQYIYYKLSDPSKLTYAEKSVLFSKAAQFQLKDAVPLIFKALDGESSINPHISAAHAFAELKAHDTKEWLERNLKKEYRETLGSGSAFDESKREELLKASKKTLELLEKIK